MAHADISKGFWVALKQTLFAFSFDIFGLLSGFLVASQLGVFRLSPWAIALYPAVLGAKNVMGGLLSGRLSTGLHLGTVHPSFVANTKSFYNLLEALVVVALATSVAVSSISLAFGHFFWGLGFMDFPALFSVVVATIAFGLSLFLITAKVAFFSFKKGLDPDIVVYPVISAVYSIFITLFYIVALNLFFLFETVGQWVIIAAGLSHLVLVLYILSRNLHEPEFIKTLKESIVTMVFVAFIVNATGTALRGIRNLAGDRREYYIVYPALIGLVSDVGSVVGSTATTKLALGLLKPSFSSIRHHARSIFSAWLASVTMMLVFSVLASLIRGSFSMTVFYHLILILIVADVIAVAAIVLFSYAVSILTFRRGLNPGNFVIPFESSLAGSVISIALLIALVTLRFF